MRTLRRLLRQEHGISLLMAVGVLGVLTIASVGLIGFSTTNARNAEASNDGGTAYSLAEGALAHGLAVLNHPPNNPMTPTLLPSTSAPLEGGTATYSGSLTGDVWTLTAKGQVPNPTGVGAPITRKITAKVQVTGIVPGATPPEWDRIFHNSTSCLDIIDVTISASVTAKGDICLQGTGKILKNTIAGAVTKVQAGDDITLAANSSVGTSGTPVAQANVTDKCSYNGGAFSKPCTGATHKVYAGQYLTPTEMTKPTIDFAYWWKNAKPGPKQNCTVGSFSPGFDNNAASTTTYDGSKTGSDEVTPTNSSYTCEVRDAQGNLLGEMSWNHVTHVLKINGTIFIDGDVRFDDDGQLVNYQGRAILYAGGDIEFDERVCAGGTGTFNCHSSAANMSNWDPSTNMLIIVSAGDSEYDQGQTTPLQPAAFQGVMYAKDDCIIHQAFKSSGPIICDYVDIYYDGSNPSFHSWPALEELIAGQMYGYAATAPEHTISLTSQSG